MREPNARPLRADKIDPAAKPFEIRPQEFWDWHLMLPSDQGWRRPVGIPRETSWCAEVKVESSLCEKYL